MKRRQVACSSCEKPFWVDALDSRLEGDGSALTCGTCDLSGWESVAVFTGPAEMLLVEESGGSSLLDVLDSFGEERVRVIVLQRKRSGIELN